MAVRYGDGEPFEGESLLKKGKKGGKKKKGGRKKKGKGRKGRQRSEAYVGGGRHRLVGRGFSGEKKKKKGREERGKEKEKGKGGTGAHPDLVANAFTRTLASPLLTNDSQNRNVCGGKKKERKRGKRKEKGEKRPRAGDRAGGFLTLRYRRPRRHLCRQSWWND